MTSARPLVLVADSGHACSAPLDPREFEYDRIPGTLLLARLARRPPNVVVIADAPPDADAVALAAAVKKKVPFCGVLVVLAREDVERSLAAFAAGADDCLHAPVDPRVTWAHVRALATRLARLEAKKSSPVARGPLRFDLESAQLTIDGAPVSLTRTQTDLLALLLIKPGWTVRRSALLAKLRSAGGETYAHALDVHISNLRRKLGRCGSALVSVKGLGYRFDFPDD